MKIRDTQITFTAEVARQIVALAGGAPSGSDDVVTLVEVDNSSQNGVVDISEPENGKCYRAIYPTTSIHIGEVPTGATFWIEFTCGNVGYQSYLTLAGRDDIFFVRSSDADMYDTFRNGEYYQLRFTNNLGRIYAEFMHTTLLAPLEEEE